MSNKSQYSSKGIEALKNGNLEEAYNCLSHALESAAPDRNTLMGLALAARGLGRHETSLNAIEQLLLVEPQNLQGLIIKADALSAKGDARLAASFYLAAVQLAPPPEQLSTSLAGELNRAQQACAQAAVHYEEFLRERVKSQGLFDGSGQDRKDQALDILFGRRQVYQQQPTNFFFPELPQKQFYDPAQFTWTQPILEAREGILEELQAILEGSDQFQPYVPTTSKTPHVTDARVAGNPDWGAFHLIKDGKHIAENIAHAPKTMSALAHAPQPNVPGKSPVALYSRLKPSAHIPPHTGLMNTRLICHLPLIAPEGCALRVGNQERIWRNGEFLIFDDSIEHEARNTSSNDRIILLFDIWRPELSEDEQAFVETVLDAVEEYGAS